MNIDLDVLSFPLQVAALLRVRGLSQFLLERVSDSGVCDETAIRRSYALGASAFLVKPPEFSELVTAMKHVTDFWLHQSQDEQRALQLLKDRNAEYDKLDDDDETLVTDEGAADIDENAEPEPDSENEPV